MQRRASSWNGATIAAVGQAVKQRVQEPHRFFSGGSGSSSRVVKISDRKIQLPSFRLIKLVCLPTKPKPERWAKSRSKIGPVSTYDNDRVFGPPSSARTATSSRSG